MTTTVNEVLRLRETPAFFGIREIEWRHDPWVQYGEKELGDLLTRRGYDHLYEQRFYPFVYRSQQGADKWGGFTPDFYLPPTNDRPGINVELTFADKGRSSESHEHRLNNLARLATKREKIRITSERYGVETILVTYRVFMSLRQNPKNFDALVRQAVKRHRRRARSGLRPFDLDLAAA